MCSFTWQVSLTSLKSSATSSPIWLSIRSSFVSACDHGWEWECRTCDSQCLTWFTRKASIRCRAPSAPILFTPRSSVVSVCDHRWEWECCRCDSQCLTRFTLKASLRWRAPSAPILFTPRSSVVSVCDHRRYWEWSRYGRQWFYFVHDQGFTEILSSFITDIVPPKSHCGECLWPSMRTRMP